MVDLGGGKTRIRTAKPHCCFRRPYPCVGYRSTRTDPEIPRGSLPVVWPGFQSAFNRWIGSKVLLYGTQATILDRCAPLDDAGDRSGPTLGRLLEGISDERARCLKGVSPLERAQGFTFTCQGNF